MGEGVATLDDRRDVELVEVWRRRFHEAHDAGMSIADSALFADSQHDIGVLRQLVADGCPAKLIARIVL